MGHEITFQEVIGGGSSDVKPIEINVVATACARMEYERGGRRVAVHQERRSIDRAPARRYARNKSREIALGIFYEKMLRGIEQDREEEPVHLYKIKSEIIRKKFLTKSIL